MTTSNPIITILSAEVELTLELEAEIKYAEKRLKQIASSLGVKQSLLLPKNKPTQSPFPIPHQKRGKKNKK